MGMKVCEDCFGKLWPGLVARATQEQLHIKKCEIVEQTTCDNCGRDGMVLEIWYEGG